MLNKFVCVRLVGMNDVDINQFKFDYDLTWAALFMHHDGTVLARYGSGPPNDKDDAVHMKGIRRTMERVVKAHAQFKRLRARYVDKRGKSTVYQFPKDIPSLTIQKALGTTGQQKSCVHCHNIYDGIHESLIAKGVYDPRKLWKYPPPENVGLTLDPVEGNIITEVSDESPADRAGLREGDIITALNGQPILSIADVQFVLNSLNETASLTTDIERGSTPHRKRLILEPGWRKSDLTWRGSLYPMPPRPGLWVDELLPGAKRQANIPGDKLALEVKGVYGKAVNDAGLKNGDIIIQSGKLINHLTAGEFHQDLRLNYFKPGSILKLDILRDNEERKIEIQFVPQVQEPLP